MATELLSQRQPDLSLNRDGRFIKHFPHRPEIKYLTNNSSIVKDDNGNMIRLEGRTVIDNGEVEPFMFVYAYDQGGRISGYANWHPDNPNLDPDSFCQIDYFRQQDRSEIAVVYPVFRKDGVYFVEDVVPMVYVPAGTGTELNMGIIASEVADISKGEDVPPIPVPLSPAWRLNYDFRELGKVPPKERWQKELVVMQGGFSSDVQVAQVPAPSGIALSSDHVHIYAQLQHAVDR